MPNKIVGYIFVLMFSASLKAESTPAPKYSMADLEVLETQKNYEEFLLHAKDVIPSKRDKHWVDMVQTMAIGLIDFKRTRKSYDEKSFNLIEELAMWPSLRQDEFFQVKRERYSLNYFRHCFENQTSATCLKKIESFWPTCNKNAELGLQLATIVRQFDKQKDVWDFISPGVTSNYAEFYCNKKLVQKEIMTQMLSKLSLKQSDAEMSAAIAGTMHSECWRLFSSSLARQFMLSEGKVQEFSYRLLKAGGAMDEELEDVYLVTYILGNPKPGEIFNRAWSRVRQISELNKRRERLLVKLKTLDPLPDRLFDNPDQRKKRVLMNFLGKHIPEYFDFYAKTCLDYLEGVRDFPNGNPTMRCKELFKDKKYGKLVSQPLHTRYSSVKKW